MDTQPKYTIRPLKWTKDFNDYSQAYTSDSAAGGYEVRRHREDCEEHDRCQVDSHGKWSPWQWTYCFAEYYDEGHTECANPKEGKTAAEAHWRERMLAGLDPAT